MRPKLDSLSPAARDPRRRRKIRRSTQMNEEIIKIAATVVSSPRIRKKRGISDIMMTRKSDARFTTPFL
jgi:hypothetical protein